MIDTLLTFSKDKRPKLSQSLKSINIENEILHPFLNVSNFSKKNLFHSISNLHILMHIFIYWILCDQ